MNATFEEVQVALDALQEEDSEAQLWALIVLDLDDGFVTLAVSHSFHYSASSSEWKSRAESLSGASSLRTCSCSSSFRMDHGYSESGSASLILHGSFSSSYSDIW